MKKVRGRTVGVFFVAALSGAALLHVSQNVQQVEGELAGVKASYRSEREAIHVLNAEWAYLNSPERLEVLAGEYLDLGAPGEGQMVPKAVGLPISTIVKPIVPFDVDGKSALLRNISQTVDVRALDDSVSISAPTPGRKPKAQGGDFKALLKGLDKGGAR